MTSPARSRETKPGNGRPRSIRAREPPSGAPLQDSTERHGSKAALGRPATGERISRSPRSTGVTLYEPEELVISRRAPERPRARSRRCWRRMASNSPSSRWIMARCSASRSGRARRIGGVIAVNACGPRRIKAGAARDHLLGFRCVTGRGEIVKSGGRVMKNVTGYDLSKLVAGSYGTLAALTEVDVQGAAQGRDGRDAAAHGSLRRSRPRGAAPGFRLAI